MHTLYADFITIEVKHIIQFKTSPSCFRILIMQLHPNLKQIPVENLIRGKFQPRVVFDEESIIELANSIRSNGLLQPVIVRPTEDSNTYEIIAGERRWRAARIVGLDKIHCLINTYSDKQAAAASAIENLNRADLNPIEEANAYKRLIDEFSYSHEEVAATIGKSRAKITNSLRLLTLSTDIMDMLIKGKISESHGKIIAGLPKEQHHKIASKCKTEQLSVRQLENVIKLSSPPKKLLKQSADSNINNLEIQLSEHLGTPVSISYSNGKGNIKIHFQTLDILDGVFENMQFKPDN